MIIRLHCLILKFSNMDTTHYYTSSANFQQNILNVIGQSIIFQIKKSILIIQRPIESQPRHFFGVQLWFFWKYIFGITNMKSICIVDTTLWSQSPSPACLFQNTRGIFFFIYYNQSVTVIKSFSSRCDHIKLYKSKFQIRP